MALAVILVDTHWPTIMIRSIIAYLTIFICFIISSPDAIGQCPTLQTIMVDACATEQFNEFIIIHSGSGFTLSDLYVDFDSNNNGGGSQNHDINIGTDSCFFGTPNTAVYTGCSNLIPIGSGFNVPPNSIVIIQTSAGANTNYNFSAFCGAGQCVYVAASTCTRTVGAFTNAGSGMRSTIVGLSNNGCANTYTYDRGLLTNADGAYFTPPSTYGVAGCNVPPIPPAPPIPTPSFDPVGPFCQGENFTLPGTSNNGINGTWSPVINNNATTTYTFTPTAGQCANTAQLTVVINTPVAPTFNPVGPFCQGENFTLPGTSNNGINGTWAPAINNNATTTYTFTPTAGQCANTTQLTVVINPATMPTFDPVGPFCQGENFTLPGTSNNGINGTWAPAINNNATTTYTFTPTAGQCASTAQLTVVINLATTPTFDPVGPFCQGENFSLPGTSNNGINGTWSPAINNNATTTYTFTPTSGQCANTTQLTVVINPATTPTFDPVGPFCQGENFTLPGTSNNGINGTWSPAINNNATTTYTFTPTSGQCANTAQLTVVINTPVTPTFNPVGPFCQGENFTLPGTSNNGINGTWSPAINNNATTTYTFTPTSGQCANTAQLTVFINTPVTPTFNPVGPFCQGENFTLPGTSNNGINGTWSPAINNNATTTYTFTPTSGQCANTTQLTVVINTPVTPAFNPVGPFCQGENFSLPGTSNNGINGTWSPAINNNATTTYTFTPTAGQCANTAQLTVVINPATTPTFNPVGPFCQGENFTLPGTSNNGINGTWSPAINNNATTTYTFTPTAGQCANTAQLTVVINTPVTPVFNPVGPFCQGENFTLPGTSNNGINGTWSPAINNNATTTYTFTPTSGQCANTAQLTVVINTPVTPTFNPVGPFCQGENFTLPGTSNNGINGTWSPAINNNATTTYTFTPTSGQCANTVQLTVVINTPVTPTFNPIGPLCPGENFSLPTTSLNGISGTWSPAINLNATTTYTFTPGSGQCAVSTQLTVVIQGMQLFCTTIQNESTPGANDGEAQIQISGGYPNYSINISGPVNQSFTNQIPGTLSLNNLPPGTYLVLVEDDNGCTLNCTFIINPSGCMISAEVESFGNVSCHGGNDGFVELLINGANGSVVFNWDGPVFIGNTPLATNLPAGNYFVTITDAASCATSIVITITEPDPILLICTWLTPESNPGAQDGSISVSINGGMYPGTIYVNGPVSTEEDIFSEGDYDFQGLPGGNYAITFEDQNGCIGICNLEIPVCGLSASISITNPISCHGGDDGALLLTVMGNNGAINVAWNNGLPPILNPSGLLADTYSVTITDSYGCTLSQSIALSEPTPLTISCNASPEENGNDGQIELTLSGGQNIFTIDCSGPINRNYQNVPSGTFTIEDLTQGTYTVYITDQNGCQASCVTIVAGSGCILTVTLVQTQTILCHGEFTGALLATVANGSGNITYNWQGPVSIPSSQNAPQNLPAGNYFLTVTDEAGCSAMVQIQITQPLPLNISGTSLPESFPGANDGQCSIFIDGGTSTFTLSYSGPVQGQVSNTDQRDITITNLPPGSYFIEVVDANGCVTTMTIVVRPANCAITLSLTIVQGILCHGDSSGVISTMVNNHSGNLTYNWFGPVSIPNNEGNPSNLPAGQYFLTVTDENGCSATSTAILFEPSPLQLACASVPTSAPGNSDGSLVVNVTGGTPDYQVRYTGPVSGNVLYNSPGIFTIMNLPTGNYLIEVEDENGCTASCQTLISSSGCSLFLLGSFTPPTCHGGANGRIRIIPNGAQGNVTYTWIGPVNPGNVNESNMLTAGTYRIAGVDEAFCSDTFTIVLTEPLPIELVCRVDQGESSPGAGDAQISFQWTNGNPSFNYEVTGPAGTIQSFTPNFSATVNQLVPGLYTVVVTDARGCTATCTLEIPGSPCTISVDISLLEALACFGDSTAVIQANVQNATGNVTYAWSPNLGNTNTLSNVPAGLYQVQVTDVNGCSASASITVTSPSALIFSCSSTPASNPAGMDGSIQVVVSGGTPTYQLNWSGPVSGSRQVAAGTNAIVDLPPGLYTLIITDSNGCSATCASEVDSGDCDLDLQCAVVQHPSANQDNGRFSISWNGNAACEVRLTLPNGMDSLSTVQSPFTFTNMGAGIYRIIITDPSGCADTCSLELISTACTLMSEATIRIPTCTGNADGSISILPLNVQGNAQIKWNTGQTDFNLNVLVAGMYSYTITDDSGCSVTEDIELPDPLPLQWDNLQVINGTCDLPDGFVRLDGVVQASLPAVLEIGAGQYNVISFPFVSNPLPSGVYSITFTDVNGCRLETSITVTSVSRLTLEPENDIYTTQGTSLLVDFFINGNTQDLATSELYFNNQLLCTSCTSTSFVAEENGEFFVRITDVYGCSDEIRWFLYLISDNNVFVPTIFTPNRDGINDIFRIYDNDNVVKIEAMEIFNRWGDRVFELYQTEDIEMAGWDGTYRNQLLNPDVFVYQIRVLMSDGSTQLLKGEIFLAE
jgi:gliding motility-associated-like protein